MRYKLIYVGGTNWWISHAGLNLLKSLKVSPGWYVSQPDCVRESASLLSTKTSTKQVDKISQPECIGESQPKKST